MLKCHKLSIRKDVLIQPTLRTEPGKIISLILGTLTAKITIPTKISAHFTISKKNIVYLLYGIKFNQLIFGKLSRNSFN